MALELAVDVAVTDRSAAAPGHPERSRRLRLGRGDPQRGPRRADRPTRSGRSAGTTHDDPTNVGESISVDKDKMLELRARYGLGTAVACQ